MIKSISGLFFSNSESDLSTAKLNSKQNSVIDSGKTTPGLSKKNTSMSSFPSFPRELFTPLTDSSSGLNELAATENNNTTYTPPCIHICARLKRTEMPPIKPLTYGVLKQQPDQKWMIEIEDVITRLPVGKYYFVKLLNHEIRLTEAREDEPLLHLALAQNAEHVLYAGEIYFDDKYDCRIVEWNNIALAYNDPDDLIKVQGSQANEFNLDSAPLICETDLGYTL